MTNAERDSYVSIIGTAYLQPILDLLSPLMNEPIPSALSVESTLNNGYSSAIILISVALVESFIRRACLVLEDPPYRSALRYVKSKLSDYTRINALEEVFVLRDVLAHNHLWAAESYRDDNGNLIIDNREKYAGGDKKYDQVKDDSGERTKILKLRLFPTAVRHEDAFAVFHETVDFLLYLERRGSNIAAFSNLPIKLGNDVEFFKDFIGDVPDPRPI